MSKSTEDDVVEEAEAMDTSSAAAVQDADTEEAAVDDPAEVVELENSVPVDEASEGPPDPESETVAPEHHNAANDMLSAEDVGAEYGDDVPTAGAGAVDSATSLFESEQDATKLTTRLPISKIKKIMKFDPEVTMANQDAVFLVSKATELFIEGLVKHAGTCTTRGKRKTVQKRDIEFAVDSVNNFAFLEGVLEAM